MRIISIKKGFTTNSSASTFWVILEKNEKAKKEFADQLAEKCSCPGEVVAQSVDNFFNEAGVLAGKNGNFWHRFMRFRGDTHDKVPEFGSLKLPPFGLSYQKINRLPWKRFGSVILGLEKIEWSDWIYRTLTVSNRTTDNFMKTIRPISRKETENWCMKTAYTELLDCAAGLDDKVLNGFVMKLLMVYNTGIFDIERAALVNIFYSFLERAASARQFKVNLTKVRLPDTKYVTKLRNRYHEATGRDLEQTVMSTGSELWDKFLITYNQVGFEYTPLPAAVKTGENVSVYPAGGFTPGLRAVILCSDAFGLRDEFEKMIAASAAERRIEGRLASLLLLHGEKYMNEKIL